MSNEKKLVLGDEAKYADCRPVKEDQEIVESRHRALCLMRLRDECHVCPNSKFALVFDTPEKKLEQVRCPRWDSVRDLWQGKPPDRYEVTELATCKERPFPFCGSCPSREELAKLEIDKSKDGWITRWARFRKEDNLDD